MSNTYYDKGSWNIICDYSGHKIKRSNARYTWNGYLVRKDLWEPRQPQDFVRGRRDNMSAPPGETRGEGTDVFLTANEVTVDDL
jgi:hypothetical protein